MWPKKVLRYLPKNPGWKLQGKHIGVCLCVKIGYTWLFYTPKIYQKLLCSWFNPNFAWRNHYPLNQYRRSSMIQSVYQETWHQNTASIHATDVQLVKWFADVFKRCEFAAYVWPMFGGNSVAATGNSIEFPWENDPFHQSDSLNDAGWWFLVQRGKHRKT